MTSTPDPVSDASKDPLWDERCDVLYKAWVQVRYHRRRQRFFDLADKVTTSATILLGASLMGKFLDDKESWLGVGIASLAMLALIFGYSDRKQLHKELGERAAVLVEAIRRVPSSRVTDDHVAGWQADYAALCGRAPPPLRTLTLICEREQSMADGHPDHVPQQHRLRRMIAHFWS